MSASTTVRGNSLAPLRPRRALLAAAAAEFLERHDVSENGTETWNRAIDEAGQPGDDRAARAFRRRTRAVVRKGIDGER